MSDIFRTYFSSYPDRRKLKEFDGFRDIKRFFKNYSAIDTALAGDSVELIVALHKYMELQFIDSRTFGLLLTQFHELLQAIHQRNANSIKNIQNNLQKTCVDNLRSFNAYDAFMYSLGGVFIGLIFGLIITAILITSEGKTLSDLLTVAPMGIGALIGLFLDLKTGVIGLVIGLTVGALFAAGIFVGIEHEALSLPALVLPFVLTGIAGGVIGGLGCMSFNQAEHKRHSKSVNEKSNTLDNSIHSYLNSDRRNLHTFWHLTKVSDSKVAPEEGLSLS